MRTFLAALAVAFFGLLAPANAALLVNNPPIYDGGGFQANTGFNDDPGNFDFWNALHFNLGANATLQSAVVFSQIQYGLGNPDDPYTPETFVGPSQVFWRVLDGSSGSPGAEIAAGTSQVSTGDCIDPQGECFNYFSSFELPNVALSSGEYFLAMQFDTGQYRNMYMGVSSSPSGIWRAFHGDDWAEVEGLPAQLGFAVSLYGEVAPLVSGVPDTQTWILSIIGFMGAGFSFRLSRERAQVRPALRS